MLPSCLPVPVTPSQPPACARFLAGGGPELTLLLLAKRNLCGQRALTLRVPRPLAAGLGGRFRWDAHTSWAQPQAPDMSLSPVSYGKNWGAIFSLMFIKFTWHLQSVHGTSLPSVRG